MYRNHSVGVVVPAYNEERFLADVVRDLPAFVDSIFLVDDASTDATWREMGTIMREEHQREPIDVGPPADVDGGESRLGTRFSSAETVGRVTRLRHEDNRGPGGAVKTGYLAALESDVDVIATVDGDGQMDCDRLPAVLDPIVSEQAGYAKGNRFTDGGSLGEMPTFRLIGNALLTGLTRISSGYWRVTDPQNGFTAISQDALRSVDVEGLSEYYGYMNQLLAQLNAEGVTIADVPIPVSYGDEESGIRYAEYIPTVSMLLITSFLQRLWAKSVGLAPHPVVLGYALGLAGAVATVSNALAEARGRRRPAWPSGGATAAVALAGFVAAALLDSTGEPTVRKLEVDRRSTKREPLEVSDGRH